MSKHLINIMELELQTLESILTLAEEQREALVHYNDDKLLKVSEKQEVNAKKLFELENERINFLSNWLQISKSDAQNTTLTMIEEQTNDDDIKSSLLNTKIAINDILNKINNMNSLNRLLANRARRTIHEILSVISGGNNHVCNVKI